ncbi:MAG: sigma-70 family RNA polymerase sigma factor [Planctomycetes bacterium]|nr:sigma-70 family RNA polymerase sigma factor [Planctomycetota bacterium]
MGADDDSLDLVRRCLDGQEAAQRELVRRYTGLCLAIASRILGGADRASVEDAVQDAFYAIFARLGQWQGRNLAAWVGTIAARQAIGVRRRLQRTRAERSGLDATDVAARQADNLADLRDAVDRARARMTPRQQRILDALLEGKPKEQIAREVALSPRMVYYELDAIRRLLKDMIGGDASAE